MNDLKVFMAKVSEDQGLAKKVMAAKDAAEVVAIAATAGYKFTADDLMDEQMSQVAGGFSLGSFFKGISDGAKAVTDVVNAGAGAVNAVANGVGSVVNTSRQVVDNVKRQF